MNEPIVQPLNEERDGEGLFVLVEDFTEDTIIGPITVPKGYVTDFASIPRIGRFLFPQCGRDTTASVLHDWLLHLNDKRATKVFNDELKKAGVGALRRWPMVAFVWAFTFPELHLKDASGA